VTVAFKTLLEQAMELPDEQRAELAALLLRSLEPDDEPNVTDAEWQEAWALELDRRMATVRDGTAALVDGEAVLRDVRSKITSRRS